VERKGNLQESEIYEFSRLGAEVRHREVRGKDKVIVRKNTKYPYKESKSKDDTMAEKAKISQKGQVTIPKSIRETLGLEPGKKVSFEVIGKEAVIYPEIEDPLEELKQLREEVRFDEKEIEDMIESSKNKWSKLS